ncbi:MAG: outer membrane beta-barrel protein [Lentimicrobium sp.]|nr:outer membrane beta-barrel protein [Lentimicrobium sp.]
MKRFTVLFFLLLSLSGFAQRYGEIGLIGGGMYYLGDLNPGKQFMLTKPAFGGFIRHNFDERLSVRGAVMFGSVKGDDAVSNQDPLRNLNFESKITDFSGTIEVNFFDYFIGSMRHFVTPYMYGGATLFLFNPKGNVNGSLTELRPLLTEGQSEPYSKVGFAIPFGIGFKYSLNSFLGMSLDWGMRKTFTDYLDDVSTTYYLDLVGTSPGEVADPAVELASDPTRLHNAGMQRGDSAYNDWYSVVSVSISVRLNYLERERCLNIFY